MHYLATHALLVDKGTFQFQKIYVVSAKCSLFLVVRPKQPPYKNADGPPAQFSYRNSFIIDSPPTGAHFGPKKGYMLGSIFKQARCKIVICVLYNSIVE